MINDIFSNLHANTTIFYKKAKEVNGCTFIVPDENAVEMKRIDLIYLKNEMLEAFFRIGALLEESIDIDTYMPLFFEDLFFDYVVKKTRNAPYPKETKMVTDTIEKPDFLWFADSNSPFLSSTSVEKETIVDELLYFVNKYGYLNILKRDLIRDNIHDLSKEILPEYSCTDYQYPEYFWANIAPASIMTYDFFEIYMAYVYPGIYAKNMKLKKEKSEDIFTAIREAGAGFTVDISIDIGYQNNRWTDEKHIKNVLDVVKLYLFYSDNTFIKRCKHCNEYFITSNQRAVYCSPVCRNRENVKKSYERKKRGAKNGQHNETE